MPDHLITIAINAHNYGHLISRAIQSALNQDYLKSKIEVLVVDDGSTDDTPAVVSRFGKEVRYVQQANRGQAAAINSAISLASGNIVCLLDADDQFYPHKVRRVAQLFADHPGAGAVLNKFDIVDRNGSIIEAGAPARLIRTDLKARALFWRAPGIPTSGISLRRSAVQGIQIPEDDFRICADSFLLSILPVVTEIRFMTESLHRYVLHGENRYQSLKPKSREDELIRRRTRTAAYAEAHLGERFFTHPEIVFQRARNRELLGAARTFIDALSFLRHTNAPLAIKYRSMARCAISGATGALWGLLCFRLLNALDDSERPLS